MTLCNMAVEFSAFTGIIAPDDAVFDYLAGKTYAPKGEMWDQALTNWRELFSDANAVFDHEITIDCADITPRDGCSRSSRHVRRGDQRRGLRDRWRERIISAAAAKRTPAVLSMRVVRTQTQPPRLANDLIKLKGKGVKIYVVEDALRERGIEPSELIEGLDFIARARIAQLFADYDQVWHW